MNDMPAGQGPAISDEEKPLDPAVERVRRKMMRLMFISIGIMLVGLMAVLFAIVYKVSSRGETAGTPAGYTETALPLPPGARVVSQSLSANRLTLLVEMDGGKQSIYVFDIERNRLVGRVDMVTE